MPGVVVYTFNPSTKRQKQRHTELSVLQSKFQNSQDYTETPSFLNKQTNKRYATKITGIQSAMCIMARSD